MSGNIPGKGRRRVWAGGPQFRTDIDADYYRQVVWMAAFSRAVDVTDDDIFSG